VGAIGANRPMDATQDNVDSTLPKPSENTSAPADQIAAEEGKALERDEKGRYRNPVQPRIDELTRKANTATREAEYWKSRTAALEAKANPPAPPPAKPTPDQFDTYDAYVESLTEWKADERVSKKLAERDESSVKAESEKTRQSNWAKSVEAAKAKYADYDSVLSQSEVNVAPHVTDLLLDSEQGAELAYYLDRNPDVADKLNDMSEKQAARELGRIEARLSAEAPAPAEEPPEPVTPPPAARPKTSAAPAPARPVTPTGRAGSPALDKMGMDEYVETRRKQGASWARR
jgi:hypothetical protein